MMPSPSLSPDSKAIAKLGKILERITLMNPDLGAKFTSWANGQINKRQREELGEAQYLMELYQLLFKLIFIEQPIPVPIIARVFTPIDTPPSRPASPPFLPAYFNAGHVVPPGSPRRLPPTESRSAPATPRKPSVSGREGSGSEQFYSQLPSRTASQQSLQTAHGFSAAASLDNLAEVTLTNDDTHRLYQIFVEELTGKLISDRDWIFLQLLQNRGMHRTELGEQDGCYITGRDRQGEPNIFLCHGIEWKKLRIINPALFPREIYPYHGYHNPILTEWTATSSNLDTHFDAQVRAGYIDYAYFFHHYGYLADPVLSQLILCEMNQTFLFNTMRIFVDHLATQLSEPPVTGLLGKLKQAQLYPSLSSNVKMFIKSVMVEGKPGLDLTLESHLKLAPLGASPSCAAVFVLRCCYINPFDITPPLTKLVRGCFSDMQCFVYVPLFECCSEPSTPESTNYSVMQYREKFGFFNGVSFGFRAVPEKTPGIAELEKITNIVNLFIDFTGNKNAVETIETQWWLPTHTG